MPLSLYCRLLCKTWLAANKRFNHSKRMQPNRPNWRKEQGAVTKRQQPKRPSSTHAQSAEPKCQIQRHIDSTLRVSIPSNLCRQNFKPNNYSLFVWLYCYYPLYDQMHYNCVRQCYDKSIHSLGSLLNTANITYLIFDPECIRMHKNIKFY